MNSAWLQRDLNYDATSRHGQNGLFKLADSVMSLQFTVSSIALFIFLCNS